MDDVVLDLHSRIERLVYALQVSMCVHQDAESMTGHQRDMLAINTLKELGERYE